MYPHRLPKPFQTERTDITDKGLRESIHIVRPHNKIVAGLITNQAGTLGKYERSLALSDGTGDPLPTLG